MFFSHSHHLLYSSFTCGYQLESNVHLTLLTNYFGLIKLRTTRTWMLYDEPMKYDHTTIAIGHSIN